MKDDFRHSRVSSYVRISTVRLTLQRCSQFRHNVSKQLQILKYLPLIIIYDTNSDGIVYRMCICMFLEYVALLPGPGLSLLLSLFSSPLFFFFKCFWTVEDLRPSIFTIAPRLAIARLVFVLFLSVRTACDCDPIWF